VAETEAAAHGIEALRHLTEIATDGSDNAPELAEFAAAEGDDASWSAPSEDWAATREPWTEFDLPDVATPGSGTAAEAGDSQTGSTGSTENDEGRRS
jgi:hypothetical protein